MGGLGGAAVRGAGSGGGGNGERCLGARYCARPVRRRAAIFRYQPEGWSKPYRFVALRTEKPWEELEAEETEQYQLFETSQYKYRVFVTDMSDPVCFVVWFYGQRGGSENLIKEANNDAGLAAHPSGRFVWPRLAVPVSPLPASSRLPPGPPRNESHPGAALPPR